MRDFSFCIRLIIGTAIGAKLVANAYDSGYPWPGVGLAYFAAGAIIAIFGLGGNALENRWRPSDSTA